MDIRITGSKIVNKPETGGVWLCTAQNRQTERRASDVHCKWVGAGAGAGAARSQLLLLSFCSEPVVGGAQASASKEGRR